MVGSRPPFFAASPSGTYASATVEFEPGVAQLELVAADRIEVLFDRR
jgi:hypothetical protein